MYPVQTLRDQLELLRDDLKYNHRKQYDWGLQLVHMDE